MWKIKITYDDKSKLTLTGKHKDIPYRLAIKYFMEYVNGRQCEAIYQQYPKKDHPEMDLFDKIDELENCLIWRGFSEIRRIMWPTMANTNFAA